MLVEFANKIRAILQKLRARFPRCFRVRVSDPFDEILTTVAIESTIEDAFDFPVCRAGVVDRVGRRTSGDARRERVGEMTAELGDVENGVSADRGRESEPISDGRDNAIDAVRARVARKELVRRTILVRVVNNTICGDVNHITDDEFFMAATTIGVESLPILSDEKVVANHGEDRLQGVSELSASPRLIRDRGVEQAGGRGRMIAEIRKERCDASRGRRRVVVRELEGRKKKIPVFHAMIDC